MIDRKKLISEIVEEITSIKRKIEQEIRCCFMSSDMTYTQSMIIRFVEGKKIANIKEIATNLGVTSSAATQQVDSLVANGYLARQSNDEDRRVVELVLTPKTVKYIASIKSKFREQFIAMFGVLSDEELSEYGDLNRKIIKGLK